MTATLARPPAAARQEAWRERLGTPAAAGGGWAVTLLVTLVGGLLRLVRLDLPTAGGDHGSGKIFDEIYYSCDAQNLLRYGVEHATRSGPNCVPTGGGAFVVHPPLGKWAIALGELVFGVNTFGWRVAAALAGTLTILLVVRIGRRLTGSSLLGGLAGLLLSLDGLHFVQSRVAMLDVFLCLWVVAAFGALVVDRDRVRGRLALADPGERGPGRLARRPWLLVAGLCLGAAVATKWSALYFVAVLVLLALAWEVGARRAAGIRRPVRATLPRAVPTLAVSLVALPAVGYLLSWAGWFVTDIGWDRHWADGRASSFALVPAVLRSWWHYQWEIYHFHSTLVSPHPYQSHPAGWLVLARPVSYYFPPGVTTGRYGCQVATCAREVLALGTPALWWAFVPATLGLLARWAAHRDWRAGALTVCILAGIGPWELSDLSHRTMFLFYALPSVPFLCLGLALLTGWAIGPGQWPRRAVASLTAGAYTAAVAVNFWYLYPILAAVTIPYKDWLERMWFSSWI